MLLITAMLIAGIASVAFATDGTNERLNKIIVLKAVSNNNSTVSLSWNEVEGAASYRVSGSRIENKLRIIDKVTDTKCTVSKINNIPLKKHAFYKFYVTALDNKDNPIYTESGRRSYVSHVMIGNTYGKFANPKSIKFAKTSTFKNTKKTFRIINMNLDNKKTIKLSKVAPVKVKNYKNKSDLKNCGPVIRYYSNNKQVATVNKNGKVQALSSGVAFIRIMTINGLNRLIRINVSSDEYNFELNSNGGVCTTDKFKVKKSTGKFLFPVCTREDYVFLGWAYNKNADQVDFSSGVRYSFSDLQELGLSETTKLYAVWSAKEIASTQETGGTGQGGQGSPTVNPKATEQQIFEEVQKAAKNALSGVNTSNPQINSIINNTIKTINSASDEATIQNLIANAFDQIAALASEATGSADRILFLDMNGHGFGRMMSVPYGTLFKDLKIEEPKADGYVFKGWCTSSDGKTLVDNNKKITDSTTIYAKWQGKSGVTYAIQYWGAKSATDNAGYDPLRLYLSSADAGTKIVPGDSTYAPSLGFAGYIYDSSLQENKRTYVVDGNGTTVVNVYYVKEASVQPDPEQDHGKCKLIFDLTGHQQEDNALPDILLDYGEKATAISAEATGYTFLGWFKDKTLSDAWDWNTEVTANATLYAKWRANEYKVHYDKNNVSADGSMSDDAYKYGKAYNLTTCAFEYPGYKFAGWSLEPGDKPDKVKYRDTTSVMNLTETDGETVNLYAQWIENDEILISYKSKDNTMGTVSRDSEQLKPATGSVNGSTAMPKSGYEFWRWTRNGEEISGGANPEFIPQKINGNYEEAEYVAEFRGTEFKVIFDGNGEYSEGTVTADATAGALEQTLRYASSEPLNPNLFRALNTTKVFAGWNTERNGSGISFTDGISSDAVNKNGQSIETVAKQKNNKLTLYAQWHNLTGGRVCAAEPIEDLYKFASNVQNNIFGNNNENVMMFMNYLRGGLANIAEKYSNVEYTRMKEQLAELDKFLYILNYLSKDVNNKKLRGTAEYTFYDSNLNVIDTKSKNNLYDNLSEAKYYEIKGETGLIPDYVIYATTDGDPHSPILSSDSLMWSEKNKEIETSDVLSSIKADLSPFTDGYTNYALINSSAANKEAVAGDTIWSWIQDLRDNNLNGCNDWIIPSSIEYATIESANPDALNELDSTGQKYWTSSFASDKFDKKIYSFYQKSHTAFTCDEEFSLDEVYQLINTLMDEYSAMLSVVIPKSVNQGTLNKATWEYIDLSSDDLKNILQEFLDNDNLIAPKPQISKFNKFDELLDKNIDSKNSKHKTMAIRYLTNSTGTVNYSPGIDCDNNKTMPSQTFKPGEEKQISENIYEPKDTLRKFVCWNNKSDYSGKTYQAGECATFTTDNETLYPEFLYPIGGKIYSLTVNDNLKYYEFYDENGNRLRKNRYDENGNLIDEDGTFLSDEFDARQSFNSHIENLQDAMYYDLVFQNGEGAFLLDKNSFDVIATTDGKPDSPILISNKLEWGANNANIYEIADSDATLSIVMSGMNATQLALNDAWEYTSKSGTNRDENNNTIWTWVNGLREEQKNNCLDWYLPSYQELQKLWNQIDSGKLEELAEVGNIWTPISMNSNGVFDMSGLNEALACNPALTTTQGSSVKSKTTKLSTIAVRHLGYFDEAIIQYDSVRGDKNSEYKVVTFDVTDSGSNTLKSIRIPEYTAPNQGEVITGWEIDFRHFNTVKNSAIEFCSRLKNEIEPFFIPNGVVMEGMINELEQDISSFYNVLDPRVRPVQFKLTPKWGTPDPVGGHIYYVDYDNGMGNGSNLSYAFDYCFYDESGNPIPVTRYIEDGNGKVDNCEEGPIRTVESLSNAKYSNKIVIKKQDISHPQRYYVVPTASGEPGKALEYEDKTYRYLPEGFDLTDVVMAGNLGSGKSSTNNILSRDRNTVAGSPWAEIINLRNNNYNGCNDWFVPSPIELVKFVSSDSFKQLDQSNLPYFMTSLVMLEKTPKIKLDGDLSIASLYNSAVDVSADGFSLLPIRSFGDDDVFRIHFKANDSTASGTMDDQIFTDENEEQQLAKNTFTNSKKNRVLVGWTLRGPNTSDDENLLLQMKIADSKMKAIYQYLNGFFSENNDETWVNAFAELEGLLGQLQTIGGTSQPYMYYDVAEKQREVEKIEKKTDELFEALCDYINDNYVLSKSSKITDNTRKLGKIAILQVKADLEILKVETIIYQMILKRGLDPKDVLTAEIYQTISVVDSDFAELVKPRILEIQTNCARTFDSDEESLAEKTLSDIELDFEPFYELEAQLEDYLETMPYTPQADISLNENITWNYIIDIAKEKELRFDEKTKDITLYGVWADSEPIGGRIFFDAPNMLGMNALNTIPIQYWFFKEDGSPIVPSNLEEGYSLEDLKNAYSYLCTRDNDVTHMVSDTMDRYYVYATVDGRGGSSDALMATADSYYCYAKNDNDSYDDVGANNHEWGIISYGKINTEANYSASAEAQGSVSAGAGFETIWHELSQIRGSEPYHNIEDWFIPNYKEMEFLFATAKFYPNIGLRKDAYLDEMSANMGLMLSEQSEDNASNNATVLVSSDSNPPLIYPSKSDKTKVSGFPVFRTLGHAGELTVEFNANGGTGEMDNQRAVAEVPTKLNKCEFTGPEGAVFLGWDTQADGLGFSSDEWQNTEFYEKLLCDEYVGNLPYSLNTAQNGGKITLYAQWAYPTGGIVYPNITKATKMFNEGYQLSSIPFTFYDKDGKIINVQRDRSFLSQLSKARYYSINNNSTTTDFDFTFYVLATTSADSNEILNFDTAKASSDASSSALEWGTYNKHSNLSAYGVGAGYYNTQKIIDSADSNDAFKAEASGNTTVWKWIDSLREQEFNGCNDWYIPADYELYAGVVYLKKFLDISQLKSLAGNPIWTSTEYTKGAALNLDLSGLVGNAKMTAPIFPGEKNISGNAIAIRTIENPNAKPHKKLFCIDFITTGLKGRIADGFQTGFQAQLSNMIFYYDTDVLYANSSDGVTLPNVSEAIQMKAKSLYGYVFKGYNTKADGSGKSYHPGDTIEFNKDTAIYAQWKMTGAEEIGGRIYDSQLFEDTQQGNSFNDSATLSFKALDKNMRPIIAGSKNRDKEMVLVQGAKYYISDVDAADSPKGEIYVCATVDGEPDGDILVSSADSWNMMSQVLQEKFNKGDGFNKNCDWYIGTKAEVLNLVSSDATYKELLGIELATSTEDSAAPENYFISVKRADKNSQGTAIKLPKSNSIRFVPIRSFVF